MSRHLRSLERKRIRARLLACGVTLADVARQADVDASVVSHVLAGRRSVTSPAGRRVVDAATRLAAQSWADLSAPLSVRPLAA